MKAVRILFILKLIVLSMSVSAQRRFVKYSCEFSQTTCTYGGGSIAWQWRCAGNYGQETSPVIPGDFFALNQGQIIKTSSYSGRYDNQGEDECTCTHSYTCTPKSFRRPQTRSCFLNGSKYSCQKDVAYGSHPSQKLDIWRPQNYNSSRGLVVYIHGGGFYQGDKSSAYQRFSTVNPKKILDSGFAFASINYRLSDEAHFGAGESIPPAMADSAKAIQFLRSKAKSFGFNKRNVALTGGSAGGAISLWLAFHDDLSKPGVSGLAGESTRVSCAAVFEAQTTLNMGEIRDLLGADGYEQKKGLPAFFGINVENYNRNPRLFDRVLAARYKKASPISHISSDDKVKVLMTYNRDLNEGDIHSPELGIYLAQGSPHSVKRKYKRKSLEQLGISHEVHFGQHQFFNKFKINDFLINRCF